MAKMYWCTTQGKPFFCKIKTLCPSRLRLKKSFCTSPQSDLKKFSASSHATQLKQYYFENFLKKWQKNRISEECPKKMLHKRLSPLKMYSKKVSSPSPQLLFQNRSLALQRRMPRCLGDMLVNFGHSLFINVSTIVSNRRMSL